MLNKTPKGAEVLQKRSMNLPPRQRTLLLLSNGERAAAYLLKQTEGLGATSADLEALISLGLLEDKTATPSAAPAQADMPAPTVFEAAPSASSNELSDLRVAAFAVRDKLGSEGVNSVATNLSNASNPSNPSMPMSRLESHSRPFTEAEKFEHAYRTATKLSAELGLRGFRLQLSIERASSLEDLRALRPKLLEALTKESGEAEGAQRLRVLDRLLR